MPARPTTRASGPLQIPVMLIGRMVARKDFPTGGFEFAGAGVYLPAPEEAFRDAVRGYFGRVR